MVTVGPAAAPIPESVGGEMSVILTDDPLEITSYTERARIAREARNRYRVDVGRLCRCDSCGAEHYRKKANEDKETKTDVRDQAKR